MMNSFGNGIWISEQPQKFFGIELGARMTAIDLGNGDLLVHSPIQPTDDLMMEINQLGNVKWIIAPNLWHHLYVKAFKEQFPEALLFCAPGLEVKRKDLSFDEVIAEGKVYPWSSSLKHQFIKGAPLYNEVVFYHEKSRTLLVTDLGLHICENSPWKTRLFFKALGIFKKYGWSKTEKWLFVRNKKSFKDSISKVLTWDFDNIILSHGVPIKGGGKETFRKAFG